MFVEYSFSTARSNLTELIDKVQHMTPAVIRPRKKTEDASIVLSRALLRMILRESERESQVAPRFITEPDRSVTVALDPLDIAANAVTREAAVQLAIEEAVEYAKEYLDPENMALYLRSPNRRSHLPTVIRIAICDSPAEVAGALNIA